MYLVDRKDSVSKLLFFLTLFVTGVLVNGYEQVYCMPTLEAKIILAIVAFCVLMSTIVKKEALQFLIFLGIGMGFGVYLYLLLLWGETLFWGIIWVVPFVLALLILLLFGIVTWVIGLAWVVYIQTGSIVLIGMIAIVILVIIWKLEKGKEIWLQRFMVIPFGIALMAHTPIILAGDSIVLFLKGSRLAKIAFGIGLCSILSLAGWHYVQYQNVVRSIAKYNNEDLSVIVGKEGLESSPYFEKLLGAHIKYHTKFCEYDGRRPPIHDPFFVLFFRMGNYPKVLAELSFAERVEHYRAYNGNVMDREDCNCAYFRDKDIYWESVSFQNALRFSLERNVEEN